MEAGHPASATIQAIASRAWRRILLAACTLLLLGATCIEGRIPEPPSTAATTEYVTPTTPAILPSDTTTVYVFAAMMGVATGVLTGVCICICRLVPSRRWEENN